jgi:hypothetical protein
MEGELAGTDRPERRSRGDSRRPGESKRGLMLGRQETARGREEAVMGRREPTAVTNRIAHSRIGFFLC